MTENVSVKQHKKVVISNENCRCSIEISDCAIDNGFLLQFPGPSLAIFLYLVTHINDRNTVETNPTIISSYLSNNYKLNCIKEGLKYLEKHDIIETSPGRQGDYTYKIKLNIDQLGRNLYQHEEKYAAKINKHKKNKQMKNTYFNNRDIRQEVLDIKSPARSDLFKAILTFIPPDRNPCKSESSINQWLEDFDTKMIKELIRRVDKWIDKYDNPPEKAFHYLKGIVDDWYQKDISNYQRLQHFDKLYRETRELAKAYGLTEWHNIKPVHMETFNNWLAKGFPLSISVVKLAIKEAIKRKKDGQPSIQYIEDNFINPWKKAEIRTVGQANKLLKKNRSQSKRKNNRKNSTKQKREEKNYQDDWNELSWDFEK